jgi:hypothetical protein
MPVHVYRNEEERWFRLLLGSVLSRLVAPPIQPGVAGSYPVRGVWLPGHLLWEGTDHF